jgi:hypothetical protein
MTTDGGLHWTVVRATVGGIKYDLEITTRGRLQEGDLVSHGQRYFPPKKVLDFLSTVNDPMDTQAILLLRMSTRTQSQAL